RVVTVSASPPLAGKLSLHDALPICQIFPSAGNAWHLGLAAELSFGADLACDPGDFGGETAQLIDHGVDRVFELENLAAHVDSNLLRQIAVGDGDSDVSDVAHLGGQVAGHHVDVIQIGLPTCGEGWHCCL